jgi:hypothetical protein
MTVALAYDSIELIKRLACKIWKMIENLVLRKRRKSKEAFTFELKLGPATNSLAYFVQ